MVSPSYYFCNTAPLNLHQVLSITDMSDNTWHTSNPALSFETTGKLEKFNFKVTLRNNIKSLEGIVEENNETDTNNSEYTDN